MSLGSKITACDDHEFQLHPKTRNVCHICYLRHQAKWQRESQARVRQEMNNFKLASGCAKCGYNENVAALQFDHIVALKLGWGGRKKRTGPKSPVQARELMNDPNVQVLCANCHAIKTREEGDYKPRES